jgi:hypothetical protein
VVRPDHPGVGGLRVEIVNRTIGPTVPLAEAATDDAGRYQVSFTAPQLGSGNELDLQARVYAGDRLLAVSEVRYNAGERESLDVRLPANCRGLPSEYEMLVRALAHRFTGSLGSLKESAEQQDITYLANKTGWDARAIAMAALADRLSRTSADQAGGDAPAPIDPAFYYALLRAGMPADPASLFLADLATVERVWIEAIDQAVIPPLTDQVPAALAAFQRLAGAAVLDAAAPNGISPVREMLALSVGDDPNVLRRVGDLYARYRTALPEFWSQVGAAFDNQVVLRLQLNGQLGQLTLNNAPLVAALHAAHAAAPLTATVDLARRGYYRAADWQRLLDGLDHPANSQPPGYAEFLAAQVRLSFPTAVLAEQVNTGEVPLTDDPVMRDAVHAFLVEHQGRFEIGMCPIEQYVRRSTVSVKPAPEVRRLVTRLQRVYQITPTDQAMSGLLRSGLDSATAVARYDRRQFVERYAEVLGGSQAAELTHAKAQLVHNAVLNVATSYVTARSALPIGYPVAPVVPLPPVPVNGGQPGSGIVALPTLEGLFGSMDYCSCTECRSILSPAAYLVDLLLFLGNASSAGGLTPQQELFGRRPEIEMVPLTCANTNTPLPYIDLVNEILENHVAVVSGLGSPQLCSIDDQITAQELRAAPQFVNDAAYQALQNSLFPLPLPFHRSLEVLRRYFQAFNGPLAQAMETLRGDDGIDPVGTSPYGWRDILLERLAMSREEFRLLSDHTLTLQQLYGFDSDVTDAEVISGRHNVPGKPDFGGLIGVKAFARRIGVSYDDVTALLKTRFVNPNASLVPRLERLGVSFATLKAYKDGQLTDAQFTALLPAGLDPAEYGGDIGAWVKNDATYARIMSLLTIHLPADAGTACSVDGWELRYVNPDPAASTPQPIEFVRLSRFIRLWKKLGLTIPQTDQVITALYPPADQPTGRDDAADLQALDAGFAALIPRVGVVIGLARQLGVDIQAELPSLLACFAPIGTDGDDSLYRSMFLNPALRHQDPAFADNGYGDYLPGTARLLDHTEALRGASGLTGPEFSLITNRLGYDANTTLTVETISAIYRRGWLARKLVVSVEELLSVCAVTGIDPFASPHPPTPGLSALLALLDDLSATGMRITQALYLLWNEDLTGTADPGQTAVTGLARDLRTVFRATTSQLAVVADPDGSVARARMTLVYGAEATDVFFGLLENTLTVAVTYSHPAPALEQPILDAGQHRIAYDDFRKQLSYAGLLDPATRDALKAVAGTTDAFKIAIDSLYTASQKATQPLFDRYPELSELLADYTASSLPPEQKRAMLLAKILPVITEQRIRQQALTLIGATTAVDAAFCQAILDDQTVLHAAADPGSPGVVDLTAAQTSGLSAQFFYRATATGIVDLSEDAVPALAYSATGSQLPQNPTAGQPISAIWSGYLAPPTDGFYKLEIDLDPGTHAALTLAGAAIALTPDPGNPGVWHNTTAVELHAGTLYSLSLTAEGVHATATVRWQTPTTGREVLPSGALYPAAVIERLRTTYVRFLKAVSLAKALRLNAPELAHFAADKSLAIGGQPWLNAAPPSAQLTGILQTLLGFSRLKSAISPSDNRLLTVITDPATVVPGGQSLLLSMTGWDSESLAAFLARFGTVTQDLSQIVTFRRVHSAFLLARALGITAAPLLNAAVNEPTAATVSAFTAALHARYAEPGWLALVQPINDTLRTAQRDSLVAYTLHDAPKHPEMAAIDTPEKLFEYFLMDVEMDPCAQTSRIRHAIAAAQLLADRCLMNLEPAVPPTSISADQWPWMKRYRLWEANRKVFLWPENWLEPELRDDQSPLFTATMRELLQSDITDESASAALIGYLSKLEEIAKLEPCGLYQEQAPTPTSPDISHVVARTQGAHRKYYYRKREDQIWTPWEQIDIDIEDTPVLPVAWNGRLLLFWLRVFGQSALDPTALPPAPTGNDVTFNGSATLSHVINYTQANAGANAQVTMTGVLCWSERYNGKWQAPKTSDLGHPLSLGVYGGNQPAFSRDELPLSVYKGPGPYQDSYNVLQVIVRDPFTTQGRDVQTLTLYNTYSNPVLASDIGGSLQYRRLLDMTAAAGHRFLEAGYLDNTTIRRQVEVLSTTLVDFRVLQPAQEFVPAPDPGRGWSAPFFFSDARNSFFVATTAPPPAALGHSQNIGVPMAGPGVMLSEVYGQLLKAASFGGVTR